jgi:hypothetical protein
MPNPIAFLLGALVGFGGACIVFGILWVRMEPWIDRFVDVEGKRERRSDDVR